MSLDQQTSQVRSKSIPWLRLARMGWYLGAALALAVFAASLPGYIMLVPRGFTESHRFAFNPAPFVLTLNIMAGLLSICVALLSFCLALVLFRRRPDDRMSLFLSYFLLIFGIVAAGPIEFLQPLLRGFAGQSILVLTLLISMPLFFFLFALFPDGRFVPAWTRRLGWASFLLVPIILFTFPDSSLYFSSTPPLMLFVIGQILIFALFSGILYAQIYRYRHVSTRQQKQQTKWVVYGFGLMLTLLAISSVPWTWLNSLPQGTPFPVWGAIASLIYFLAFAFIPVSLTIAVMRFRLYDINLLINRTIVYGALTAGVVGLYILLVSLTGLALQTNGALAGAFLTLLLVAALFKPLRAGLQRSVDGLMDPTAKAPLDIGVDRPLGDGRSDQGISTVPPSTAASPPSGFWLRLTRAAWYPIAALTVAIFIISIPGFFTIGTVGITAPRFSPNSSPLISIVTWITVAGAVATGLVSLFLAVLLFRRRSEDRMALLTSFFLLTYGVVVAGPFEALEPFFPGIAAFTQNVLIPGFIPLSLFLFAVFPDGRFVPRWTRWTVLAAFLAIPLSLFWTSLYTQSPLDLTNPLVLMSIGASIVLAVAIWFGSLYAQIYRYRNISTREQKQQTKWVVYGIGVWLTLQIVSVIPWTYSYSLPSGTPVPLWLAVASIPWIFSIAVVPITLAIAVMRYRLFEIDFLINRSLVYGGLTAIVIVIYVLAVGALGTFFQARGNLLIALLATGLVAVLFQPLRERLQGGVNRLIFGERDDPIEALSRLGRRLEPALAPGAVLPTLVETIAQTLKLPYVAILLPGKAGDRVAASHGRPSSQTVEFPLVYQGRTIGQLLVVPRYPDESFGPSEMRLLRNLASQAGAAVYAVQLTDELQRSRQRLVTAREEERRRLRRDLHDGLGPTLAALHVQTNALRHIIHSDPQAAETMVTEFDDEIREAIDDIRRVVYELRPPRLDELGLVGAARAYAVRCSLESAQQVGQSPNYLGEPALSVHVEAPAELPPLPAAVEVAAYHVIREALANVVHHAQARQCVVRFQAADALIVEIVDDGLGLPAENHVGVGLVSMRERVEELGGTFVIGPRQGGGTRVMAQFPLLEA
jgi:signal transduction histidine kinase